MKKGLLFILSMLWLISGSMAQTKTVTGTITSQDGETIPGVNVIVKNSSVGTVSDINGSYSIPVPDGGVLVFSFIGFTTREVEVGNRSVVDVALESDVKQLSEVVVTAMGIEREQKSLGYAIQEVQGKDLVAASQPNLTNALQGKVAGVIVRQSSGMPGASSFITIRGSNAFDGNNQPLFVVDGLPIETGPQFSGGVSGTDASSRALDINPEDIAEINVLKGPAAAALYGLRASNGVVVITTKRGQGATEKANISVSLNYTSDQVSRTPDLQGIYSQGSGGNLNQGTSLSWGPRIADMDPYELRPGGIPATVLNRTQQPTVFDNVSPFFETGGTFNGNVDISGSTQSARYSVGAGYTKQSGFVPTTGMERRNVKLAGDFDIAKKLTIGGSANYSDVGVDKIAGGSNLSNPLFTTYFAPRSYDLWGIPFSYPDNQYRQIHYRGAMDNPRWALQNNSFAEQTRRIFGNTYFNYKPFEFLSVNYRIGLDYFMNDGKEVYGLGSGGTGGRTASPSGGQITDFSVAQNQINSNLSINFNKRFMEDKIGFGLLVGNEVYDIRQRRMTMTGTGIAIGGFNNISNTSTQVVTETQNNSRVVGFYGQLTLDYNNFAFLTATGRNDIVSNMPSGNRSFFYPSLAGSLVLTEAFKLSNEILNFAKVRASWAQVGQAGPLYATRNIFIQGGSGSGFLTDDLQFPFNGLNGFTQSNILRSTDLEPQNTNTWEVGFDVRLFNGRVGLEYTYYNIDANGQIFEVPLAASTGFTSELRNAGEMNTKGHEVVLNLTPLKLGDFSWDITTNFTSYKNEVISLADGVDNIFLGGFVVPNVRAQAGSPYPIIFGSGFLRDDAGNIVVLDDPSSAFHGMPIEDPLQKQIGQVQPDFEVGLMNTFRYKGFSLYAQIDWRQGGEMYAGNTRLAKLYGMDAVTEDRESDYVFPGVKGSIASINTDGSAEVEVTGDNDIVIQRGQTYWSSVMDAIDESNVYETTFVRFRELSLTYDFPATLAKKMNLQNLSLSLVGRNLFLWSDYPNFDPETSTGGASNFQGLEYVALPQIRSYGASLRFTF